MSLMIVHYTHIVWEGQIRGNMKDKKQLPPRIQREVNQILFDCEEERLRQLARKKTTFPNNWKDIENRILKKDRYICVACGRRFSKGELIVHHRDGDESNHRPNNLITMCYECHEDIPCPPFYESSYCQTSVLSDNKSVCLKLGIKAGNLRANNCPFFTQDRGCLLEFLTKAEYGLPRQLSAQDQKPEKHKKSGTLSGQKLQIEAI